MDTPERFADQKLSISAFMDEILVVCPRCGSCAVVIPVPGGPSELFSPRRLSCVECGLQQEKKPRSATLSSGGEPVDSYFHQPLWLVARHGSEMLWAYNLRHLTYIESFVRATLRGRDPNAPGCSNCSVISRLPRWIKKASNRRRVLAMITELQESVTAGSGT